MSRPGRESCAGILCKKILLRTTAKSKRWFFGDRRGRLFRDRISEKGTWASCGVGGFPGGSNIAAIKLSFEQEQTQTPSTVRPSDTSRRCSAKPPKRSCLREHNLFRAANTLTKFSRRERPAGTPARRAASYGRSLASKRAAGLAPESSASWLRAEGVAVINRIQMTVILSIYSKMCCYRCRTINFGLTASQQRCALLTCQSRIMPKRQKVTRTSPSSTRLRS